MRKLFLLTFLIFAISKSNAQQEDTSVVGFGLGYVQNGIGIRINYDYYLNRRNYLQGSINLGFASDRVTSQEIKVPYETIYLNAGYFYEVHEINRGLILFNLGGGISLGYQILNNGSKDLSSGALLISDSKFVYGLYIGADTKFFISDRWTATLHLNEYYHANSDIGGFSPFLGASINYTLF